MSIQAEWLFLGVAIKPFLIGVVAGLLLALTYSLLPGEQSYWNKLRANVPPSLGYAVPTAFIGYVAGYLTAISRSPAVGSVVPAVLALLGGLNIYFFGVDSKNRALVGYSIFVFSLVFFYGIWAGAVDREVGRVGRLINLSEQEKRVRTYRENRDLPPEIPSWILNETK
jgi:hypothetical protein